jgi:hypothetical protein
VRILMQRAHVAAAAEVEKYGSLEVRVRANLMENGTWPLVAMDRMRKPREPALRTRRAYGFSGRGLDVSMAYAQSVICSQIEDGDDATPWPSCSFVGFPRLVFEEFEEQFDIYWRG